MKFIIFYHYGIDETHYDLMLEAEDTLDSWRIPEENLKPLLNGETIEIISIKPHNKKYLNFEGALSDGRGYVKIYDKGTTSYTHNENSIFDALIFGSEISGKLIFKKIENNTFNLNFIRILNDLTLNEKNC